MTLPTLAELEAKYKELKRHYDEDMTVSEREEYVDVYFSMFKEYELQISIMKEVEPLLKELEWENHCLNDYSDGQYELNIKKDKQIEEMLKLLNEVADGIGYNPISGFSISSDIPNKIEVYLAKQFDKSEEK